MKTHEFSSYEDYREAQIKLTRMKVNRNLVRSFTVQQVVDAIRSHHNEPVVRGLCHGVRKGAEIDLLEKAFGGNWCGTEITPDLCDGERIICMDFSEILNDWIGGLDVIYSNSFDHARDPWRTAKAWLACLSTTGRLYVEWTPWHARLGRAWKGDCFAASEAEYHELFSAAGKIETVLEVRDTDKFSRLIFVVH